MKSAKRIQFNSPARANEQIENAILESIRYYAHNKKEIPARIRELEKEWDIERTLMLNASVLALTGTVLAATVNKKWLALPGIVTAFLAQHAIQGWCPPLPLFRSMGFRTRQEIESEKFALKAINGELDEHANSRDIFEAVTE